MATKEVKAFCFQVFGQGLIPKPWQVEIHYVDYSGSKIKIILWPVVPNTGGLRRPTQE